MIERRRERDEIGDVQNALVCTLLANANRDKTKHPKPFTVDEFRVLARTHKPPEPGELRRKVRAMFGTFQAAGAKVIEA